MQVDLLVELKDRLAKGLITKLGYVWEACQILQVDPASVDRQWLADHLGMSYTATTSQLHELKKKGLLETTKESASDDSQCK
jgi:predicted ArsR family transcriptional regulator